MNEYINYFLNYLQTEKDAAKFTIHKYKAQLYISKIESGQLGVDIIQLNAN